VTETLATLGAGGLAAADSGTAGPLGLLVVALLGIALFFLWRSMVKHLRRVPPSFDGPTSDVAPPAGDEPNGPPRA
jgi:hypothetical protein